MRIFALGLNRIFPVGLLLIVGFQAHVSASSGSDVHSTLLLPEPIRHSSGNPPVLRPSFVGPRHLTAGLDSVRWSAAHDRRSSAIVSSTEGVFLISGVSTEKPVDGQLYEIPGIGIVKVVGVDDGRHEISPVVARLLVDAQSFISRKQWSRALAAARLAVQYSQDLSELLSVASQLKHPKLRSALRECYSRALDLSLSADGMLTVAEHAFANGADEDAELSYNTAILTANDRALLLRIQQSATKAGFEKCAAAARDKAARLLGMKVERAPLRPSGSLAKLTVPDRQLYAELDEALRDPETHLSLVEKDLPKLLSDGPLLRPGADGRRALDWMVFYLNRPIARSGELESMEKATLGGLTLRQSILADLIHSLANLPGRGIHTHAIFQGFGTNTCVAAVTQVQLAQMDPAAYTRLVLGLIFDGAVSLGRKTEIRRVPGFMEDEFGVAQLSGRTPLDAIVQNSLMKFAFDASGERLRDRRDIERLGLRSGQIKLMQDAVLGGNHSIVRVDSISSWRWKEIEKHIQQNALTSSAPWRPDQSSKIAFEAPLSLSLKNRQGGYHFLMVAGYVPEGQNQVGGYLLMDPEGYRCFYTAEELAEGVHEVVLPSVFTSAMVADERGKTGRASSKN